ncbi:hypothetical protein [Pseudonocardia phyllosphaerae]|uniref:hypothetical protein n=1 Tax=Pseudonocardia phyllosphaerae TaxID=3390502 RepID=UPI00397A6FB1
MSAPMTPVTTSARLGPASRWTAVLRAEVRRTLSVKLWWLLLVPVVLLAMAMSLFGGLLSLMVPAATDTSALLLLGGEASTMTATAIVAAAFGALLSAGEYRHRTITQSFLTGARHQVLGAKVAVAAVVGGLYGLVVAIVGPLVGGALFAGQQLPSTGALAGIGALGIVVCALWGVLGVVIGTLVPNQAGAVALTVGYLLIGENLLAAALRVGSSRGGDPSFLATLTPYLPGNAGDLALWQAPVDAAGEGADARSVLEFMVGVSAPPPGWVSMLVLVAWTVVGVAAAAYVGGRRDIT